MFRLQIKWGACALVLVGNIVTYLTIFAYFYIHRDEDATMW